MQKYLYHKQNGMEKKLATGEGKSKKIAEMEAARKALEILK